MTVKESIEAAVGILSESRNVVVFAGAGLSAASGVPTFRGAQGLWMGYDIKDVAEPQGFARDPVLVWRFYAERQMNMLEVQPNDGHFALKDMESMFNEFLLVTQNVDNLSERAGSTKLVKIHGDLFQVWCSRCSWMDTIDQPIRPESICFETLPRCPKCRSLARPGVVWFNEMLPPGVIETALSACQRADALIIVGTSGLVSNGYGLAETVLSAGGRVLEVNPQQTILSELADVTVRADSAVALKSIVEILKA